jgi:Flp pilus assembly pilin Flp
MMRTTRNAMSLLLRFAKDTSGSVAVEYTLIASIICIAIVGIVNEIGDKLVIMLASVLSIFG